MRAALLLLLFTSFTRENPKYDVKNKHSCSWLLRGRLLSGDLSAVIFSKRWVGCADKLTVVWAVEPHRDTTVFIWARADGRAKRHETEPNEKWESLLSQSHMSVLEERHWAQKQKHVEEIQTLLKLILFEHDETCKYDFYHIHHFLIIDWLFFKQYFK